MKTTHTRPLVAGGIVVIVMSLLGAGISTLSAQDIESNNRWEPAIQAFEAADLAAPPPESAILFVGSSSIRMWQTLAEDFAPLEVINRGFGGSQIADATLFADRIVIPYRPKQIVFYAGDNDIAAGHSPQQVLADFQDFVRRVHTNLPNVEIAFVSIKPSLAREQLLPQMQTANDLIRQYTEGQAGLGYIDVFSPMLESDGSVRSDLFIADGLHMNEAGYDIWTTIIRPRLIN